MIKQSCSMGEAESSQEIASVSKAEEIIEGAKAIMRKRNLQKARLILQKKREFANKGQQINSNLL